MHKESSGEPTHRPAVIAHEVFEELCQQAAMLTKLLSQRNQHLAPSVLKLGPHVQAMVMPKLWASPFGLGLEINYDGFY